MTPHRVSASLVRNLSTLPISRETSTYCQAEPSSAEVNA